MSTPKFDDDQPKLEREQNSPSEPTNQRSGRSKSEEDTFSTESSNMILPPRSLPTVELTRASERCSTGGSIEDGDYNMLFENVLRASIGLNLKDLESPDLEDIVLPDTEVTAPAALQPDELANEEVHQDGFDSGINFPSSAQRISTGEEIDPHFKRSSELWIKDETLPLLGPVDPAVIFDSTFKREDKIDEEERELLNEPIRYSSGDWIGHDGPVVGWSQLPADRNIFSRDTGNSNSQECVLKTPESTSKSKVVLLELPTTPATPGTASSNAGASPSSSTTGKKKKKRRERVLDLTTVAVKTDNDVLFGRGGGINKHPANVQFRERAKSLWSWYNTSNKETKQQIANILVDEVKNSGFRFLEEDKGGDEEWHEVIWGEHTKASQTFRDLHKRCNN